jgi:RNA polymerase sigma factor (TIGR02999 family)
VPLTAADELERPLLDALAPIRESGLTGIQQHHEPRRRMDDSISSLAAAADGDEAGAGRTLFARLYAELHRIAGRELARRGRTASLGVTTLLHEAYLDMSRREGPSFPDEARFMRYAARVMRGLIIDHARNRRALKRGGLFHLTAVEPDGLPDDAANDRELIAVGDALDRLAAVDPPLAEVVDLKFFCGFSFVEIAAMRGVSERTVQRDWEKARIYLHREIRPLSRLTT